MARAQLDKKRLAGFAQEIVDAQGATTKIDMKESFGELHEPFLRQNDWIQSMDYRFADQERTVYKNVYTGKLAKGATADDFDPTTRAKDGDAKPVEVQIKINQEKDLGFEIYAKDYEQANDPLVTIGERIKARLMVRSNTLIDESAEGHYVNAINTNPLVEPFVYDYASKALSVENGKEAFEAAAQFIEEFKKTAINNIYHDGRRYKNSEIIVKMDPKMVELITMYKSGFISAQDLINTGDFGSNLRNIQVEVMEEGIEGAGMIIHTSRAVQGTIEAVRHMKFIPEAMSQDNYLDSGNLVFGWGFKTVFLEEVAGMVAVAPVRTPEQEKIIADEKAFLESIKKQVAKAVEEREAKAK